MMKTTTEKETVVNLRVSLEEMQCLVSGSEALLKKRMQEAGGQSDKVPMVERMVSAELTAALRKAQEEDKV